MQTHRVLPGIAPEQSRFAAVGLEEAEEDADRRRLPRAVRPEEPGDRPPRHLEVEAAQGADPPETLHELVDDDR